MKLFAYDLETTGTNPAQHSIHQIAAIILVDGKEKERVEIKMQPNPKAKIDPQALEVANVTMEQINTYMPFEEGYRTLIGILDKYVSRYDKKDKFALLGYNNAGFDDNFLRGLFLQNGDNYFGSWFWADPLDVRVLAMRQLLPLRPSMENFKLMTVARQMGIEVDESRLHDAVYDVEITLEVFNRLRLTKAELQSSLQEFEFRQLVKTSVVSVLSLIEELRGDFEKNKDLIFDIETEMNNIQQKLINA
jgi:DNA polymerase-3 subunit epsilon